MGETLSPVNILTIGAGQIDRDIHNIEELLVNYRNNKGYDYLNYQSITPSGRVVPEDLAVTLLVSSNASSLAVQSLMKHGKEIDLSQLPQKPLEETSIEERKLIAKLIIQFMIFPQKLHFNNQNTAFET